MKRLLVVVLVSALLAAALAGCTPSGPSADVSGTLIVGTPGNNGDFINGFGNTAYDNWVKILTGGFYTTYITSVDGEIILNETVVKNLDTKVESTGDKTYTFTIHDDLKWNDGSKITAADYVFNILWYASKEWADAGAQSMAGYGLLGYAEYQAQEVERFKGVQLIDEHTFTLTIDGEELPYFWETTYVAYGPICMKSWAPDAKIDSNEDGAMITSDVEGWSLAFNTNRIVQTERYAPTVTCGPYKFISFENNAVNLEYNEHFKSDYQGKKPSIQYIVLRAVPNDTDIDQLVNGQIHILTGIVEGSKIEMAKSDPNTDVNSYERNGFGGMYFHTDFGPAADPIVRQAIAHLIDRQLLIQQCLGGYGAVTQGHYGLAQWMYKDNAAEIESTFINYVFNIEKANELLDQSDYRFEADGVTPFDVNKIPEDNDSYFRHNSAGEKLKWYHIGSEGLDITENIQLQFVANAPYAGVDFEVHEGDWPMLSKHYYHQYTEAERMYHSFNLASNFTVDYDPYWSFHSDMLPNKTYNTEQLSDPIIDELTLKMRQLDPEQKDEYSQLWLEFQKRFNELVPILPLYSNEYYDGFRKEVKGFNTTPFADWADVICDITLEN